MSNDVVRTPERSTFLLLLFIAFTRIIVINLVGYVAGLLARVSGASDSEIGVINGIFILSYAIAAVFFGARSDKWGRKRVILLSYGAGMIIVFVFLLLLPAAPSLPLSAIIGIILVIRGLDGWFLGAFWPPLQGRLCESPGWNDRRLRYYNWSWSVGLLVSNILVSAATVVDPVPTVLFPVLALLLWLSMGILGSNMGILWSKVQDIQKDLLLVDRAGACVDEPPLIIQEQIRSRAPSPRALVAIVAMVGYGLLWGALFTNTFNQFSQVSLATGGAVNLIPWVTVLDNVRFAAQLVVFGIAKTPAHPKRRFLALCGSSVLLLGGLGLASEFLLQVGISIFIPLVALAGLVLGLFYANGFGVIMGEANPANRGYYQGLLETISNLGYFAGIIISASISEILGYLASYAIIAAIMIGLVILVAMICITRDLQTKQE